MLLYLWTVHFSSNPASMVPKESYRYAYAKEHTLPLASRATMQDVMHEHVTLCTEIVRTVRASVPTQRAYPIRSSVRTSRSVGRVWIRVPVHRRGTPPPGCGERDRLECPRTCVTCWAGVGRLLYRHAVIRFPTEQKAQCGHDRQTV